jgi:GTP-binding protein
VVLLLDGSTALENQDLKILSLVREEKKGVILAVNKWDLMEKHSKTFDQICRSLEERDPFVKNVPKLTLSALTGQRTSKVLDEADQVWTNMHRQLDNDILEESFQAIFDTNPHPSVSNCNVRFVHFRQVGVNPPAFCAYTNHPDKVLETYKRFLLNKLCATYDFSGCPVQIYYRGKKAYKTLQKFIEERAEAN